MIADQKLALLLIPMLIVLSLLLYVAGLILAGGELGFPLDDAWIHQTYARNLAWHGQWSYVSGVPSTASTAPLWTFLLVFGYLLGISGYAWSVILGALGLGLLTWAVYRLAKLLFPEIRSLGLWAATISVLEWHLVWAAFSGMETLWFALLVLLCAERYLAFESAPSRCPRPACDGVVTGLLGGLLVLARPEGLVLLALIVAHFFLRRFRASVSHTDRVWLISAMGGCLTLLVPYMAFNLRVAGQIFPSTFYAKQAEYWPLVQARSFPVRFMDVLFPLFAGVLVVLLPGFLMTVIRSLHLREEGVILLWVWWGATAAIYAWKLPVAYQHGRYLIPTVPVFVLLGTAGLLRFLMTSDSQSFVRLTARSWAVIAVIVGVVFWVIGARSYIADVQFINNEMGEVARWLSKYTPSNARLAVHDIGLIGYILDRPFIDLAGLITPEVIPFINDDMRLLAFMKTREVNYVVVFPDWSPPYARLTADPRLHLVHTSGYAWTRAQGKANLSVYAVDWK